MEDKDILNAVLNHTTGRPEMSRLEKIIYIADYIEPNRKKAPNLEEIRNLAFEDLDRAIRINKFFHSFLHSLRLSAQTSFVG